MVNEAVLGAQLERLQETVDNLAYHQVITGLAELAALLNKSLPTVRKEVREGRIPYRMVGGKMVFERGTVLGLRKPAALSNTWTMERKGGGYVLRCGPLRADVAGDRVTVSRNGRPVDVRQAGAVDTPSKFLEFLTNKL